MPRGRHRHSPPLHRLLPPSAIAGVSLVCAVGPWLFTEPGVLRTLAAGAAVTAVVGAFVMRRWDTAAGKRVADLTRARASDEWRHEERVAELETDLDESRELRTKLEHNLRAKRAELAGLRNEHAALLRRYATAETERASALEGRRLLEIETTAPARALPAAGEPDQAVDAVEPEAPEAAESPRTPEDVAVTGEDTKTGADDAGETDADDATGTGEATGDDVTAEREAGEEPAAEEDPAGPSDATDATDVADAPEVFSPAGSSLFMKADAALGRVTGDAETDVAVAKTDADAETGTDAPDAAPEADGDADPDADQGTEAAADSDPEPDPDPEAEAVPEDDDAPASADETTGSPADEGVHPAGQEPARATTTDEHARTDDHPATAPAQAEPAAQEAADDAAGETTAHEPVQPVQETAHEPVVQPAQPVKPVKPVRPSGHFTVPTAVAVVPTSPARRPSVEGGFDFFGTQAGPSSDTVEAVQNEDLADVVGQEALALHKAEAEAGFKPVDEGSRGVGQVIDLTAHDETEHIDVGVLRSAVS